MTFNTNTLDNYQSYAYKLSLFLVDPSSADTERVTDELSARPGKFILVARSGGSVPSERLSTLQQGEEVFIDNLMINSIFSSNETGDSATSNIQTLSYDILEPIGVSFLTNLRKAYQQIIDNSTTSGVKQMKEKKIGSLVNAFFLLKIEFIGYDEDGNQVLTIGEPNYVLHTINNIKFSLDGKLTRYNVDAKNMASAGFTRKTNTVTKITTIKGSTFGEIVADLAEKLSAIEEANLEQHIKQNEGAKVDMSGEVMAASDYSFTITDFPELAESKFIKENDKSLKNSKVPMAPVSKTSESNAKAETTEIQRDLYVHEIAAGTLISKVLTDLFKKTEYAKTLLPIKSDATTQGGSYSKNTERKPFKWINILPEMKAKVFDTTLRDYVYSINYRIIPRLIKQSTSSLIDTTLTNADLLKTYNYWYTGENAEILSFTYELDTAFTAQASITSETTSPEVPQTRFGGRPGNSSSSGSLKQTSAAQDLNNVAASLVSNSPGKGTMQIIGDPVYLSKRLTTGQTYIQLLVNAASDYNMDSGLLNITDRISFSLFPDDSVGQGLVFLVSSVESRFDQGAFKQTLSLSYVPHGTIKK